MSTSLHLPMLHKSHHYFPKDYRDYYIAFNQGGI